MKILHVVYTPRYSGAEILVLRMAEEQVRQGHQVQVVSMNPQEADFETEIDQQARLGVYWVCPLQALSNIARVLFLRRTKQNFAPDVVFAHSMIPSFYMRLVAPRQTIVVLHSQRNHSERKFRWMESLFRPFTRGVICVSPTALRDYQALMPTVRSCCIENGIALASFQVRPAVRPAELGLDIRLLHVGRVSRVKRTHLVVQLVAALRSASVSVRADIVGMFEDQDYHRELQTLIESEGLADYVRFLGARDDIPTLLARADCFVLPSASEAQCIALIEALASGVPVLASDIPGNTFAAAHAGVALDAFHDLVACASAVRSLVGAAWRHERDMQSFDIGSKSRDYLVFACEALGVNTPQFKRTTGARGAR